MGGDDDSMTHEEKKEAQRQRKEELDRAERERKSKYLKEREGRDAGRDEVRNKYNIEKKPREEEEEDSEEEDDGGFGPKKKVEEEDAVTKAKSIAEDKLKDATNMMSSLFKF